MEEYMGMIKLFAGNFAPKYWALCNGQLLSISQNQALFSLLGVMYGGDGVTNFRLPDYRGRIPIGMGQSASGAVYTQGQIAGTPTLTLTFQNMPVHNHEVAPMPVQGQANFRISDNVANALASRNNAFGQGTGPLPNTTSVCQIYDKTPTFGENNHLHPSTVSSSVEQVPASNTGSVGAAQPFSVQNPFLALNYIICISGLYPSRQ